MAERIYIIKEGEFAVSKKLIHKEKEQDNNIQDILDNPQRACKLQNKYFKKNTVKQVDNYFLQYLFKGKMIGEMDVISTNDTNPLGIYTTTVKCIS